ncbi:ABC transporter permease [Marinobacterium arenosum]|uniref:ABC transporter permease n=1 Tax=Marinobacterium arenosum TaxID=2862496 RepID=UPI001C9477DC|nr:ABC transporter permease [Marinobacterium arenosum]MBY4675357.1 ABC transporter permease [Marinobacterium arenosum]
MDFLLIFENLDLYWQGALTTVKLVTLSLLLGLLLALPLAVMRRSGNPLLRLPAWSYIYVFRGTPLLIQLFVIYYGFGQLEAIKQSLLWPFFQEAYWCALLAFTLNTAAYTAEIIRGAIETTPEGELEAARAFGMSHGQIFRRILLPSAFRRALPAYSNEVIFLLHGSAVAGIITLVDITGAARIVNSRFYNPFEAFITAALFYMALTFVVIWLFKRLENRWLGHLRARS